MTRYLKLATSASGTPPSQKPDSGQSPAQPPPEERRRAAKLATRAERPQRAWDPLLDLPLPLYLVHVDDAADIVLNGGTGDMEINSIDDRVGAKTFSAVAATNRMPLDTTERPGHQVATAKTANADWLRCADATLAQSLIDAAGGAFTLFSFHRYTSAASGNIQALIVHNASTTSLLTFSSGGNRVSFYHPDPTSVTLRIADAAGTNFTWSTADGYVDNFSAWQTHIVTYDGAGNAELWVNGVSLGVKSGTHRSPSGMLAAHYGGGASGANPMHHGVKGACAGVPSDENIEALHEWMQAAA